LELVLIFKLGSKIRRVAVTVFLASFSLLRELLTNFNVFLNFYALKKALKFIISHIEVAFLQHTSSRTSESKFFKESTIIFSYSNRNFQSRYSLKLFECFFLVFEMCELFKKSSAIVSKKLLSKVINYYPMK
jgi:hypothetical protein